ncbi:MAG: nucleoside triphosphate pyrophosphatase [Thermotogota bacterium]
MDEKNRYTVIMASESPRRKELMKRFPLEVIYEPHRLDKEEANEPESKYEQEIVVDIALKKLRSMYSAFKNPGNVIVAADTMVFYKGRILGKPKTLEEAQAMLEMLSGQWHDVYTGCVLSISERTGKEHEIKFWEKTRVKFRKVPTAFIKHYCKSQKPMDKAGSYGIQDEGAFLVEKIAGDYYNVMGLPIGRLWELFLDFEVIHL